MGAFCWCDKGKEGEDGEKGRLDAFDDVGGVAGVSGELAEKGERASRRYDFATSRIFSRASRRSSTHSLCKPLNSAPRKRKDCNWRALVSRASSRKTYNLSSLLCLRIYLLTLYTHQLVH